MGNHREKVDREIISSLATTWGFGWSSESINQGKKGEGECFDIFEIGESEKCISTTI